jgi:hypothetical protein
VVEIDMFLDSPFILFIFGNLSSGFQLSGKPGEVLLVFVEGPCAAAHSGFERSWDCRRPAAGMRR